ncbi:MAG TPA: lamin tail domain-containing protein, partial [Verrucomicrobiae bacterium]|nr:lamin tail domain-containing protein [Verrucomicrobiae bacterium]
MKLFFRRVVSLAAGTFALTCSIQADQSVYTDSLQNGWQNWSWATVDFSNSTPVHSGSKSISVTADAWQAVSFWHSAQSARPFTDFAFWIHGGTSGGQTLQIYAETNGGALPAVALAAPLAGTWQKVTVPLSSLGLSSCTNMTRFNIQNSSGNTLGKFFVDDVSFISDTTAPVVQSFSPAAGTVSALSSVTVTFSEPVIGVDAGDLLLNGNPAMSVSGSGQTYTFTFALQPEGVIAVTWYSGHGITDYGSPGNAFNGSGPGATCQYTVVDNVPPVVTQLFPSAGAQIASLAQIEVTFSESVLGVQASDLLVNGSPATNVTKIAGQPYVFKFSQPPTGVVSVSWADGHGITDASAAHNAFAGGAWTYTLDTNFTTPDLVINEILSANLSTNGLTDEDGDLEDWIEIYNRGAHAVDLSGWSLTDDPELPGLWTFPARTLNPGAYLVVFASGKDRAPVSGWLHTNFKLAVDGEYLGLYSPDSPRKLVSGFDPFPEQRNDVSYGRDLLGILRYFAAPSPGAANGMSSIAGVVEPVHANVNRGHFNMPFTLVLSCPTAGATLRYTTNGSEPTASSPVFPASLTVPGTTLLRAAGFKPNCLPSKTLTESYLFNLPQALRSLPVVSIVTDSNNLWGPSGIIGIGPTYTNVQNHGVAWERPTSVEWIRPEDNSGFQVDCGIRVQGSDYTRGNATPETKSSFRLYFRGDYGTGRLNYPLFPLTTVTEFDGIVLRAGMNEQINPFIRDELHRRLASDMGEIASHGNMAIVLINGAYYTNASQPGILPVYNTCERVQSEFFQAYLGGSDQWDVVKPPWQVGGGAVDGTFDNMQALVDYVYNTANVTQQADYTTISAWLDLTNFVDYLVLNTYAGMGDWPANNWRAGRDQAGGMWRFALWDSEWGMGIYGRSPTNINSFTTTDAGLGNEWSEIGRLYRRLKNSPEFRLLWADRVQQHFYNGGALTGGHITNRFRELQTELAAIIPSMDTTILDWVRDRNPTYFSQMTSEGLLSSVTAPTFSQHGGRVPVGFTLSITAPSGTLYFTTNGTDPRVPFTGAVSNSAIAYSGPVPINSTVTVRARARQGTTWSALTQATFTYAALGSPVRITEIMYNPIGGSTYEFLELQNISGAAVDLGGMYFDGITFIFNEGTILGPGARAVLGSNTDTNAWKSRYAGVNPIGWYNGNLNNGGERISLFDKLGHLITSVDYSDSGGWPTAADGAGRSLEVVDPNGNPDAPANWKPSAANNGTPGAANSAPPAQLVILNEIMAENVDAVNNGGTFPDWIELRNPGGADVNLAGWSLTDDGNARQFVFPSTIIAAGDYLVVWCDAVTNTTPGLHTGFSLDKHGETVSLYDATTNRIDALTFGLQLTNYSLGRINGNWALNTPTANAANVAVALGGATNLAINEWLASSAPGQSDWLELFNKSTTLPVSLQGLYLATSNNLFQLTSLSFLPPLGYVQLLADEGVGPDHLDFKLSAGGDAISLYDNMGSLVQTVAFGAQTESVSQGRLPDGTGSVISFPGSISPGAPNYTSAYTGPVINEVLARNQTVVVGGQIVDYIEIRNPGASSFNMGGMSLSVNSSQPGKWIFPANIILAANSCLLIKCDGASSASTNAGSFNMGESLDGESGGVYLFNTASQLVNSVEYGIQIDDLSIGLSGGRWQLLASPTPGADNAPAAALASCSMLRVNEWMADPADGSDWFELFNPTNRPVDLSAISLTDDPSIIGMNRFLPAPLSFIAAGGFVKWIADASPAQGRNHVNFALNAAGDSILVYAMSGTNFALVDAVALSAQTPDVSQGCLPDGVRNIVSFPGSASPGESNYRVLQNVVINELLAHTDPPLEDAIEFYNPTASAVNVGGWYLSNSRFDRRKYQIPAGTIIPAGGYAVIYEYQFNNATTNAFTFNSAHGDEAWLSAANAGVETGDRTGISFGASFNGVSFGRVLTSVGADFAPLSQRTFGVDAPDTLTQFRTGSGLPNPYPLVGPVVISELMYHPLGSATVKQLDE